MKKIVLAAAISASLASAPVFAQDLTISITNLTHGMVFTPILVAAHNDSGNLYDIGKPASANLQAMAEGGALGGLKTDLDGINAVHKDSGGLLMAGGSVEVTLNTDATPGNTKLSLVSMLLPTNDAFVGLDSIDIPTTAGSYTYYLNAYDAGTEANDEVMNPGAGGAPGVAGIPADPTTKAGNGGSGAAGTDTNTNVHIHRGALGDNNSTGGNSDLDNTVHRWLNPVARVTLVVK